MAYLIDQPVVTYQYLTTLLSATASGTTDDLHTINQISVIPAEGGLDATIANPTEFNAVKLVGKFEMGINIEVLFNDVSQLIFAGTGEWQTITLPVATWDVEEFKFQVWYQTVHTQLMELDFIGLELSQDNYNTKAYVDSTVNTAVSTIDTTSLTGAIETVEKQFVHSSDYQMISGISYLMVPYFYNNYKLVSVYIKSTEANNVDNSNYLTVTFSQNGDTPLASLTEVVASGQSIDVTPDVILLATESLHIQIIDNPSDLCKILTCVIKLQRQ